MELKSVLFGVVGTLIVFLTIGAAIAVSLDTDSTLLAEKTRVDPNNPDNWMRCQAWSNTDNTKSFLCEMPNAVAVTLNNRLGRSWTATVIDANGNEIPNPESKVEVALNGPMNYFAEEYHAQVVSEWEADKPVGLG